MKRNSKRQNKMGKIEIKLEIGEESFIRKVVERASVTSYEAQRGEVRENAREALKYFTGERRLYEILLDACVNYSKVERGSED